MTQGAASTRPGMPLLRGSPLARSALALATAASFLLVIHNYAVLILPARHIAIPVDRIQPYSKDRTFAYVTPFIGSEPDRWPSSRSRVRLFEDGRPYSLRTHEIEEVTRTGGYRFKHEDGRIVFATSDNTDPRTNGRSYSLETPVLYGRAFGVPAAAAFLACVAAWHLLARGGGAPVPAAGAASRAWRRHLIGALAVFLLGLYLNTGTLSPYANTCAQMFIPKDTGYAFNMDHPHFRVVFDFVNGADRAVWDKAIMLRRILFPVLGWPLMRLLGFELGGTLASLGLNVAALAAGLVLIRRRMGERSAVFAAWAFALYPGAAYWAGMPYAYSLIFPESLLLLLGIGALVGAAGPGRVAWVSLAMGVGYLGYDLGMFFVPATVVALCWRRRPGAAALSAALQLAPQACWVLVLTRVLGQPLFNANSGIFRATLLSYAHPADWARWWAELGQAPDVGLDVFFGANFIFLPALFLFVLWSNALTSRVRLAAAEGALLASALGLFLFLNLAPGHEGSWQMWGTWIARLYQPVFPALVLFMARWWGALPALSRRWRAGVGSALALAALGNLLVIFGPILGNPGRVSEDAFYRFYNHTDAHFLYAETLRSLGRRPIGFPRQQKEHTPPTEGEIRAREEGVIASEQAALRSLRGAVADNRAALAANQRDLREAGRALAEARSALHAARLHGRLVRGEVAAEEAARDGRTWRDFIEPSLPAPMDSPGPAAASSPGDGAVPAGRAALEGALRDEAATLVSLQKAIGEAQGELARVQALLAGTRDELSRLEKAGG